MILLDGNLNEIQLGQPWDKYDIQKQQNSIWQRRAQSQIIGGEREVEKQTNKKSGGSRDDARNTVTKSSKKVWLKKEGIGHDPIMGTSPLYGM